MRHGTSNNRRSRGRNNNGGRHNSQRTKVFDSNGPDVRIRGTAHQVAEKYLALAKDATSVGDIVVAENYLQHAEHYIRLIGEQNGTFAKATEEKSNPQNPQSNKKKPPASEAPAQKKGKVQEDDLGLPASILGADTAEVVKKTTTEDETV